MRIIGTGSVLPETTVTNDMLSQFLDTDDEWISSRTGIKTRQVITNESFEELSAKAVMAAVEDSNIILEDIDLFICSSTMSPYLTPAFSCVVSEILGLNCRCFDINAGCSGFLSALEIANSYLKSDSATKVLILCAENTTRMVDWSDRSTCVLFGDGIGAVVVDAEDSFLSMTIGRYDSGDSLVMKSPGGNSPFMPKDEENHYLAMRGRDVFRQAIEAINHDFKKAVFESKVMMEKINHFLLHQANLRIIASAAKSLKVPIKKFRNNISNRGNTSSASVPILIDELNKGGLLKQGDIIAMAVFGAGFLSGASVFKWAK
jgi:3-oxoacyl-[acyl-carrier-protein] synthase-3